MQRILPNVSGAEKTDDIARMNRQPARESFPMTLALSSQDTEHILSPLLVIVDDSETVRKILEVCLHRADYEDVQSFPDGTEMLRWLMTPEARIPALVLVDLNLPKMDGYTLIRHLKAKPAFAQTIFVILTGRSGMLDKLKGRLCGAQVYLTKPFRTDDILTIVHTYLGPMQVQHMAENTNVMAYQ
jgi:twitching motility two-component system response regulator PilG